MTKFYNDLILKYFKAVDDQDLDSILATLHPNCSFSVETHGVKLIEQKEIAQMFHRLWRNHKSVKHENFYFVDDALNGSIAVRFNVVNELKDGTLVFKSNCNFFTLADNLFLEIRVYMAGENTLNALDN